HPSFLHVHKTNKADSNSGDAIFGHVCLKEFSDGPGNTFERCLRIRCVFYPGPAQYPTREIAQSNCVLSRMEIDPDGKGLLRVQVQVALLAASLWRSRTKAIFIDEAAVEESSDDLRDRR